MEILNDKEYECEICHRIFASKWNLKAHANKKNACFPPNEAQYKCNDCGKIFTRKLHLDNHFEKKNACISKMQITDILKHQNETIKQQQEEFQLRLQETLKSQLCIQQKPNEIIDNTITTNSHNTQNIQAIDNMQNIQTVDNSNSNTMNNMTAACLINYVINQYPNAKNIEDCIKIENIPKSTLIDCEDYYFNEGAMIIFKGLCDIGEENRPIHCTDASRGNYIYKTNDVWKIDVGGEAIRTYFFPVIQDAYTQVHKRRIKNNPGNSTIIGNFLTEMTSINIKKICQKTLKRLSNDFLAKNSKNSKMIKAQKNRLE